MVTTLMLTGQATRDVLAAPAGEQASTEKSKSREDHEALKNQDCHSCHAEDHAIAGPAFVAIAKKYAGMPGATDRLEKNIREGSTGTWGSAAMPPHPDMSDEELKKIVSWILSLKIARSNSAADAGKKYTYSLRDGKTVSLDFPLFIEGDTKKVNKDVFRGYELYNSYCYRCHGQDATESELAPNLRDSLARGMTIQQMISVCMTGREEKGMPAWAGFLSEGDVKNILMYVEGRRLELIPAGRPSSADD